MTKKIMVADPGHEEGSRSAETLCAVHGGALVVQAVVDNRDISPNLNGDVILAGIPADKEVRGHPVASIEIDGAIDILEHWDKVTKEFDFVDGYKNTWKDESCKLTRKGLRHLRRTWGIDGKSRKRLRKKEEQEINQRDRKFRDMARKLTLVFMGESDNIRRYVFSPVMMPWDKYRSTLDIVNKAVPFLDVWCKDGPDRYGNTTDEAKNLAKLVDQGLINFEKD